MENKMWCIETVKPVCVRIGNRCYEWQRMKTDFNKIEDRDKAMEYAKNYVARTRQIFDELKDFELVWRENIQR